MRYLVPSTIRDRAQRVSKRPMACTSSQAPLARLLEWGAARVRIDKSQLAQHMRDGYPSKLSVVGLSR